MSDFDTQRVSETARLEAEIQVLTANLRRAEELVAKWVPKIGSSFDAAEGRVVMRFGNKVFTATIPSQVLGRPGNDVTSLTSDVLAVFADNLFTEALRDEVTQHVKKLMDNAQAVQVAGKW